MSIQADCSLTSRCFPMARALQLCTVWGWRQEDQPEEREGGRQIGRHADATYLETLLILQFAHRISRHNKAWLIDFQS